MSILSAIGAWFKKTFGRSTAKVSEYRKATPAEKAKTKLADTKGPVYIKADAKRITKTSTVIPHRAMRRAKQGGMSNETYAEYRKPTSRELHNSDGNPYDEVSYKMPLDKAAFEKRLAQIQKKYPKREYVASMITQYHGSDTKGTSRSRYLENIGWDEVEQDHGAKYKPDGTFLTYVTLKIRPI